MKRKLLTDEKTKNTFKIYTSVNLTNPIEFVKFGS